ncbi:DUF6516 family protein [Falsibacillus albus]|uniref:Uncharacterized protein n=1 Tax=Falsibacillus albus TaxID=2478915 RepID=A0A3L7JV38_9BACI|nr:DUF6516 family protein [Falsibacillus albus]RLQ92282.1 hypothetical protein D9X91_19590 [Falsibacillus albus]
MKKTLGIKRTNFSKLGRLDFRDIIEEVNEIFGVEVPGHHGPYVSIQAKRIRFKLFLSIPSLKCVEFIDNQTDEIIEYFYDWDDSPGTLMKFHAHYHPKEAPGHVKEFDPFHLHMKENEFDQEAKKRERDNEYKCLYNVLLFIKRYVYVRRYVENNSK